jgi:hypothetical protein
LARFLWFHAFRRNTERELVGVLRDGPTPRTTACKTHANEDHLGIPRSVYAYLGKTIEEFGEAAFVVEQSVLTGNISPFDTGGLVEHIAPIRTWPQDEKRKFLSANTWPHTKLGSCLSQYPGTADPLRRRYLDGGAPVGLEGPHVISGVDPRANSWNDPANDWRAWTWEIRSADRFPIHPHDIYKWTCPAAQRSEIERIALSTTDPHEQQAILVLLSKYHRGGVSRLVYDLCAEQAA